MTPRTPLRKGEHPKRREQRERREAAEAVAALEAAAGECAICRGRPGALTAVFINHAERRRRTGWTVACLNPIDCDARLRVSLTEAA